MRATLEQLKAMSPRDLLRHWQVGAFPFDHAAPCHNCLLQHKFLYCSVPEHAGLKAHVEQFDGGSTERILQEHLEELYALRLFYDSFYQQPKPAEQILGAIK
jgi:hypothetical protein